MPRGTGVRPRPLLLSNGMERVGMTDLNSTIAAVTERIVKRSAQARTKYLDLIKRGRDAGINRTQLSCGNLAHGFAASGDDKPIIKSGNAMNTGIVTAHNDMLSVHPPYGRYHEMIKIAAREVGAPAPHPGGGPPKGAGRTQGPEGRDR